MNATGWRLVGVLALTLDAYAYASLRRRQRRRWQQLEERRRESRP